MPSNYFMVSKGRSRTGNGMSRELLAILDCDERFESKNCLHGAVGILDLGEVIGDCLLALNFP